MPHSTAQEGEMNTQLANKEPTEFTPAAPAHQSDGNAALISMIERAATNSDVDIEKMERLMVMHESAVEKADLKNQQERDRLAELSFIEDMAKVQAEIQPIASNADNDHTGSKYAQLDAVNKAINPILARHGFSVSYSPNKVENAQIFVSCTIFHSSGHSKEIGLPFPLDTSGSKNPIQSLGSTLSYARRYLKFMSLDLSTSDDDDGQTASQPTIDYVTDDQVTELIELADRYNINKIEFCKFGKVSSFAEIPANQLEPAKKQMEAIHANKMEQADASTE